MCLDPSVALANHQHRGGENADIGQIGGRRRRRHADPILCQFLPKQPPNHGPQATLHRFAGRRRRKHFVDYRVTVSLISQRGQLFGPGRSISGANGFSFVCQASTCVAGKFLLGHWIYDTLRTCIARPTTSRSRCSQR